MDQLVRTEEAPTGPADLGPTWSSSATDLVTTALGSGRIWATIGHGILNEVYWPSTGSPQIRDMGFIVAGPHGWSKDQKNGGNQRVDEFAPETNARSDEGGEQGPEDKGRRTGSCGL